MNIIKSFNKYEILLLLSMIFAPFTALRFSFFGISECMTLLMLLCVICDHRIDSKIRIGDRDSYLFSTTFLIIIAASIFGYIWFCFFGEEKNGSISSAIFNFAALVFVFIAMFSVEIIVENEHIEFSISKILFSFFLIFSCIFIMLYIVSQYRSSVFGLPLKYYSYYCPLADNIHQSGMVIVSLPFVGMYYFFKTNKKFLQLFIIILVVLDIIIGPKLGATKVEMAMKCGTVMVSAEIIYKLLHLNDESNVFFKCTVVIIVIILLIINITTVYSFLIDYFNDNDGDGARNYLYTAGIELIKKSPLFGWGPGSHIMNSNGELYDAHQTFIATALSSGIIGLVALVRLFYKMTIKLISDVNLLIAYFAIFLYAFGGDILRKTAVWLILMCMFYIVRDNDCDFIDTFLTKDINE